VVASMDLIDATEPWVEKVTAFGLER